MPEIAFGIDLLARRDREADRDMYIVSISIGLIEELLAGSFCHND
jgi:hypothetical protein